MKNCERIIVKITSGYDIAVFATTRRINSVSRFVVVNEYRQGRRNGWGKKARKRREREREEGQPSVFACACGWVHANRATFNRCKRGPVFVIMNRIRRKNQPRAPCLPPSFLIFFILTESRAPSMCTLDEQRVETVQQRAIASVDRVRLAACRFFQRGCKTGGHRISIPFRSND